MRVLLLFAVCFIASICEAQNVGIGTTSPQATLDVKGNQRFGGISNYVSYDSATGRIEWRNSNLYVPVSQFLLKHSAAGDGLYYNNTNPTNGQLEYRNALGNPVFFTNFTTGNGYISGNTGIGTTTPRTKLHVRLGASGHNGPYYPGAVIESDTSTYLNLLTPGNRESGVMFGNPLHPALGAIVFNNSSSASGLQFRTYTSTHMTIDVFGNVGIGTTTPAQKLHINNGSLRIEGLNDITPTLSMSSVGTMEIDAPFVPGGRFLIRQNGNVGIGATEPLYKLDIADRIRIRTGTASAGLWLNNTANTEAAFVGMEDDTHVGLYGNNGAGWKFTMNTETGALKVNNSEGTAGQVLKSNGLGASASWANATNTLYNNTTQIIPGGTSTVVTSDFTWTPLPNMTYTFTTSGNAKLLVMFNVAAFPGLCLGCGSTQCYFGVFVNNTLTLNARQDVSNAHMFTFPGIYLAQVSGGTHTIDIRVQKNGNTANFWSHNMIIQIMNE